MPEQEVPGASQCWCAQGPCARTVCGIEKNPSLVALSIAGGVPSYDAQKPGLGRLKKSEQAAAAHDMQDHDVMKDQTTVCQHNSDDVYNRSGRIYGLDHQSQEEQLTCVLLCFIKPILENRYVRSRGFIVSEPRETHPPSDPRSPTSQPYPVPP